MDWSRSAQLRRLTDQQYEWTVRDELAVGSVSPDELSDFLGRLLRDAEHAGPGAVRDVYRAGLPRTTEALGRLFRLDSIVSEPARGGGTLLSVTATRHPERISDEFPRFSRYL